MATIPATEYVEYLMPIVKGLVRAPQSVSIVGSEDDDGILLTMSVHPRDMGRVIGKDGATAKSLRAIMHTFGANLGSKVSVKILEPNQ